MLEHLSRISRILSKPSNGHGLLIGLGGNGRKTLAKLAAFINTCQIFQIDVSGGASSNKGGYSRYDWQEDIKNMNKTMGIDNKKVAFQISDSEIKGDYIMEDISSLLNVGEVHNIYTQDEVDEVIFEIQKTVSKKKLIGSAGSESALLDLFKQRCRKNLHLLLFMSPAGSSLRNYIRQYPALVNCTTIDWFLNWPESALQKVAHHFLSKQDEVFQFKKPHVMLINGDMIEQQLSFEDQKYNKDQELLRDRVSQVFVQLHSSAINLSKDFQIERNRLVYITPTRFTNNFTLFKDILLRKLKQIDEERNTYLMGIHKLEEANMIVDGMKAQLEDLKPVLDLKSKEVEKIMLNLDRETKEVESIKAIVDVEAQAVYEQKEIAEGIKNECQERLSEAQPLLDAALNALRTLNVKDFVIMKSFNTPPAPIKLALEAACIMLGIAPKFIEGPVDKATKKTIKIPDFWDKSKKLLNDYKKFLSSLENYDKDFIPDDRIHKIQEYLHNPKFVPEEIRKASEAAEGICKWVIAITKYDIIAKEIRPKREALGKAQGKLDIVLGKLREKEAELKKIMDQKQSLEEEFARQNYEKSRLIAQRDECQAKLNRAGILMSSLGVEKERWIRSAERLLREKQSIIGDVILAAASINYLGAFEGSYRENIMKREWRIQLQNYGIPLGDDFNLKMVVGNIQKLQLWQLKGLPQDSVSVENMIILEETKSFKWPIIVDPQGYALKFVKEYLDNDFISLKLQQERFTKKLEQALFQGGTVLLEGFTETFDASLSSIIFKDIQEVKGERYIKFNDNHIELNEKFKLYLICSQANPHFSPDVHSKMTLLNFSVTREGLEQQLLSVVCRSESVRDEDEKERLLRQNIEFQENKRQVEEQILEQLRNSGAEILDDDTLVNSLNESKKITDDIKHKLQSAKLVEDRIEENRRHFKPVAVLAAKLYFALQEMAQLDPMYQFSMKYYREIFFKSFTIGDKVKEIKGRVRQLKSDFLKTLYSNVCRSLFEKHKLLFAFSMAIKVHLDDGHSSGDEKRDLFNKKLKELEMLQHHPTLNQNQDKMTHNGGGGGPISVISGNQKSGLNMNTIGKLTISKKSIIDRKSDNSSQTGIQSMINQRNEEERLRIAKNELHYLLTGLVSQDVEVEDRPNTCENFIDSKTWQQVCELSTLEPFESLPDDMEKNQTAWKKFVQKSYESAPEPYSTQIPEFAQILLHKVLKPEKTIQMIQRYVLKAFGQNFLKPTIQTLDEIYSESKPHIPIILILTPGNDPMEQIKKLGEEKQKIPYPVSLGKGQGDKAKALINETRPFGGWVMLQNCHLSSSFLPELEQIIESLQPSNFNQPNKKGEQEGVVDSKKELKPPHQDFRLWLTSMSTDAFPISILQDSIKLTSEPPKGLKPSLMRIYNQIDQSKAEKEFFNSNSKPIKWKKLFLSLSFFHGIVRERRSYGSLGWNLNYDFNDSDFRISQRQLHLMIDTFDDVPFRALSYLTGECNYGGRVTDDWDRRTLKTILKDFYNEAVLVDYKYQFIVQPSLAKDYYIQQSEEFHDFNEYVQGLPDEESPQLFGLHQNASITQAINDSSIILKSILSISQTSSTTTQSSQGGGGNNVYIKMANEIISQVRDPYKIREVEKVYPFRYEESMNSVLLQELARFNNLIEVIKSSLHTLIKALEGKILITVDLEKLLTSITNNSLPEMWKTRSYPSKKPLMSYIKDLKIRLKMLDEWIEKGQPNVFWISGFFFTQSFLTGVKQNYARKYQYPIDKVTFRFQVYKHEQENEKAQVSPQNGCFTTGLYLEGASWNDQEGVLQESEPKVLFTKMPIIHFIPELEKEVTIEVIEAPQISLDQSLSSIEEVKPRIQYQCPVYKTSDRAGTLSTTGHSTNYILTAILPSNDPEDLWVKRSVALIASLND